MEIFTAHIVLAVYINFYCVFVGVVVYLLVFTVSCENKTRCKTNPQ